MVFHTRIAPAGEMRVCLKLRCCTSVPERGVVEIVSDALFVFRESLVACSGGAPCKVCEECGCLAGVRAGFVASVFSSRRDISTPVILCYYGSIRYFTTVP